MRYEKIYISGAITGLPNDNAESFQKAEELLTPCSNKVINPLKLDHSNCNVWGDYMRNDIKALMDCNAIYMLNGYKKSHGAMVEYRLAKTLGMQIVYEKKQRNGKGIILFKLDKSLSFPSIQSASDYIGVNKDTLLKYLKTGKELYGYEIDYLID